MNPALNMAAIHHLVCVTILLVGVNQIPVHAQDVPEVVMSGTRLRGVYVQYNESEFLNVDATFEAYLGIPFAEPPVGDLRFRNPVKKGPLGSIYLANRDRSKCPQVLDYDTANEDCLYLGVQTPSPRPNNVPVVVWLHGGAYISGAGSYNLYDPSVIMAVSPDIVVVTINYRLGLLGFLTTGDGISPGNYGMLDQVMALEWVQENIAAFGGDPSKVTIMGESAGAASVGIHLLSPLSGGLFSQAIMESGNALVPWAVDTNVTRQVGFTQEIAGILNCSTTDNAMLVECMREVGVVALLAAQAVLTGKYLKNELLYVPVVDGVFLPDAPIEIVQRREFHVVPTLLGTNVDEGTLIALRAKPAYLRREDRPTMTLDEFREKLPPYIYFYTPAMASAVEQWYIDWSQADNSSADQLDAFIDLNTDQVFACGTEAMARAIEEADAPVYRYEMTHVPSRSIWGETPGWMGAGHGEDIQFVFGWGLRIREQTPEEKVMSIQIMRYWTNFIKTGNPNDATSSSQYPPWPRYTLPEQEYKVLSLNLENGRAMRADACAFWLNYAPTLYNSDFGESDDSDSVYQDWETEYEEWRDVHMAEWQAEFNTYKDDNGC